MFRSCPYCGRMHQDGIVCPRRPDKHRYGKPRVTPIDRFRKTAAWQRKRSTILDRDFHMCRICNEGSYGTYAGVAYYSKNLSVHHIEPLSERFDLRLEDDNLITCCSFHHKMAEDGEIPRQYLHRLTQASPRWDAGSKGGGG